MNTIGIITPKGSRTKKGILGIFKPDYIFIEKHLIRFVIAYDNQNYNKIFKKHNVKTAVCAKNAVLKRTPEVKICNGNSFFEKYLMYFIIKSFKFNGLNSENATISLVFDCYTNNIEMLVIQASKLFRYIIFVTDEDVEEKAALLMNEYGIDAVTVSKNDLISCDMSVELSKDKVNYRKDTIVINIDSNIFIPKEYNIIMPKNIRFEVNKVALAEALSIITQND